MALDVLVTMRRQARPPSPGISPTSSARSGSVETQSVDRLPAFLPSSLREFEVVDTILGDSPVGADGPGPEEGQ